MISLRFFALPCALVLALAFPGCVLSEISITGRPCPCLDGWVCDATLDICVPADSIDAGTDAQVDAGPPPPTCDTVPGAIFCDDFEPGDLARWTSIEATRPEDVVVSAAAARSGMLGLHVVAPVGSTGARLVARIDTSVSTELWMRAWVRVRTGAVGAFELFDLSSSGEGGGSVSARMIPATESFALRVIDPAGTQIADDGRAGRWMADDVWVCIEAYVVRGGLGRVEVVDPARAALLVDVATDWGTPYDVFAMTLEPGSEIDVDDVTWTTTRLRCIP